MKYSQEKFTLIWALTFNLKFWRQTQRQTVDYLSITFDLHRLSRNELQRQTFEIGIFFRTYAHIFTRFALYHHGVPSYLKYYIRLDLHYIKYQPYTMQP